VFVYNYSLIFFEVKVVFYLKDKAKKEGQKPLFFYDVA